MKSLMFALGMVLVCALTAQAQFGGGGDGGDSGGVGFGIGDGGGGGGIGFSFGGGLVSTGGGGAGGLFQLCVNDPGLSYSTLPLATDQAIAARSCLQQAEQHSDLGDCAYWPYNHGGPTYFIIYDFNNKQGTWCPANYGGEAIVTVCANGAVLNGKQPC